MNKFKVGQRVKIKATEKEGKILEIDDVDIDENGSSYSCYNVFFPDGANHFFTVHDLEEFKPILKEKEREYLKNIIKPYKNDIGYITKEKLYKNKNSDIDYIRIHINTTSVLNDYDIKLPPFFSGDMYTNMHIFKKYKAYELDLL